MRLVHLNSDPGIGPQRRKGAAIHVQAMRHAFRRCGAEVLALDLPEEPEAFQALKALHAAGPVQLLYERYALGRRAGFAFSRQEGIPYVLEVNAPLAEEERRWRGGGPGTARADADADLFRGASLVLAVSDAVAAFAVRQGAPPERVWVRSNAVDAGRFRPRGPDDPLRARLAPAGRFVLGFHGRLRPWHGFGLLVEAMARLLDRGRPVHLLAFGEGGFHQHLAGLPESRFTLLDWVPHEEVGAYVACFDALPLTYPPDAPCYFSPLKLAEAMAAGVVPVVPDLGDLPRVVAHGRTGLVYTPGDLPSLVGSLERLMADPDLRRRLASAAVDAATRHTWEGLAAEVLEHFHLREARAS